jgi:hypothetical protein
MAGAGPDQALMGSGEHLDRLGLGAVAGDAAMVVPIGAHQIGHGCSHACVHFQGRGALSMWMAR